MRRLGAISRRFAGQRGDVFGGALGPVTAFTPSGPDYWEESAASAVTAGSTTMTLAALFRINTAFAGTKYLMSSFTSTGGEGYALYHASTAIRARVYDGTATAQDVLARTYASDDLNKTHFLVATLDSGTLTVYWNGVETGSASVTGYTASTQPLALGALSGAGNAIDDGDLVGHYVSSDTAISSAEVSSWWANIRSIGNLVDPNLSSTNEDLWVFDDAAGAPVSFDGQINSTTINKQGTGGTEVSFVPVFGT
ncbi:MAG: hypothetical protein GWN58_58480 [Anaerolineae bacterium]|nr:hypothetical protein [Anaerolineae bacterium]